MGTVGSDGDGVGEAVDDAREEAGSGVGEAGVEAAGSGVGVVSRPFVITVNVDG